MRLQKLMLWTLTATVGLTARPLLAQEDGAYLYKIYCAICHEATDSEARAAGTSRSEADDARAHLTGARGGCDEDSSSRAEPHAAPDSGGVPVGKEIWKRAARHHSPFCLLRKRSRSICECGRQRRMERLGRDDHQYSISAGKRCRLNCR